MKECNKCNTKKPITEYYISNRSNKPLGQCKECYKNRVKKYNKKWVSENQDKVKKYRKDFRQSNPNYMTEYMEEARKDPLFRISMNMRIRLGNVIRAKNYTKRNHLHEVLGVTWSEFENYISLLFEEGMNWDNYGEWELDHIKPLATAVNGDEIEKLFHYKNLQPLWKEDNRKKRDRFV